MYTIDASVWVNAFDQQEPGHAASRQLLDLLASRGAPIVVPGLVLAEVAGAISRTRHDPVRAREFAESLGRLPGVTVLQFDAALTHSALVLAAQHGLRGADAVYAAVAVQAGAMLISLDNEHLTRLAGIVRACTSTAVMADLTSSPEASTARDETA
jgi:predicted nucleic acid-binding protein